MKNWTTGTVLFGLGLSAILWFGSHSMAVTNASETRAEPQLAHMVFFTLKERTPEGRKKLVESCKKYLSKHQGTVYFSAGTLCEELNRPVNDRDFDVALHVVFKTKADHDKYQEAPLHLQFIAENKDTWAKVRVFDSFVE